MNRWYRRIARLVPRHLRRRFKDFFLFTGIKVHYEAFIGFALTVCLLIGLAGGFICGAYFGDRVPFGFWVFFFVFTLVSLLVVLVWLLLLADRKVKLAEEALPDALQLMASNLRAGMTTDKALLFSSRPEFGPLKEELDIVGRKVTLGKDLGTALAQMAQRIKSTKLVRAQELITLGLNSGGSLALLLEASASDLREQSLVEKKIRASVTMYVIFIFSAAAIVSPVLFGLSSYLVEIITTLIPSFDLPSAGVASLPISISQVSVSPMFLNMFITVFLVSNTFFASLILGLISKGKQKDGLRYYVPMLVLALPIFWMSRYLIALLLNGLLSL